MTAVEEFRGSRDEGITLGEIDRIVERVSNIASSDPGAPRAILARLRGALASDAPPRPIAPRDPDY